MFPFFSSLFGFASSNEHTTSWEAMAIRQREEELFYTIKEEAQLSEEELKKIKHLIHNPLFKVNRLYHTENITETLLHQAIKYKQFKVALCLVEKGADLSLQDTQGHTPLQCLSAVKSDITPALKAALKRKEYISHLPRELLLNILEQLPLESLDNASKVSRQFNNIIQDWRFWMKYLHPHYQALMGDYIERLRKENRDEVQVEQKASRYLKKVIKEAPYTVRPAYFEFLFKKEYTKWQFTTLRHEVLSELNILEPWKQKMLDLRRWTRARTVVELAAVSMWGIVDEELALTFLRHTEIRKFVLEDNTKSLEWLLDIFLFSIRYKLYGDGKEKPITYALVGASRLSSALFILKDNDYREKLEKGLREDQGRLEIILRRLHFIMSDRVDPPHRGDAEAQENAKLILKDLKALIAPETSKILSQLHLDMSLTPRH
jgi:hypothetical protein